MADKTPEFILSQETHLNIYGHKWKQVHCCTRSAEENRSPRFRIRNTSLAGLSLASVTVPVKKKTLWKTKLVFRIQTSIDKEEDLSIIRIPVHRRKVKTKSTGTKLKKSIDTGTCRYENKPVNQKTTSRILNTLVLDKTYQIFFFPQNLKKYSRVLAGPDPQGSLLTIGPGSARTLKSRHADKDWLIWKIL
jgi:hypothetical protein